MKKPGILIPCAILLLCTLLLSACDNRKSNENVDVRNDGTAIQWKYGSEDTWHELVKIDDLKGAAGKDGTNGTDGEDGKDGVDGKDGKDGVDGKDGAAGKDGANGTDGKDGADGKNGVDGKDGKNGVDGKDGVNGKAVEVKKTEAYIQWRYAGEEWQNLVALSDITGPVGAAGSNGADGKTPEFRVDGDVFQWRYMGEKIWLNLYDLSLLKGADGKDGIDGKDGKDGVDGKDGIDGRNGADGKDGKDGIDGKDGVDGRNGADGKDGKDGIDGKDGVDGKDGMCAGYFYAQGNSTGVLAFTEKNNYGGLIIYNYADNSITLKKGHTYSLCFNGSVSINAKKEDCTYGVALADGYDNTQCMNSTLIRVNATKGDMSYQAPVVYSRIYAADEDITLTFQLTNYMLMYTTISLFNYNLTVIALE